MNPVSLVIPGRNCAATIAACVRAATTACQNAGPFEVLYVDDGSDDDDGEAVRPSTEGAEYEFSDGEDADGANRVKPPNYPAIIRDGDDSSEWSDSSDEEVEELDMANMPRWLEDIKNGVDRDLDDDACHAEPPRTKNEIPEEQLPAPPPPPP